MSGATANSRGWSWRKAAGATAVEPPPHPLSAVDIAFNDNLVSVSQGLIPPLSSMKLCSLGGGHTNTFLRQCNGGVNCVVDELKDDSGNLSAALLAASKPAFQEALQKGLVWTVLSWETVFVWPELANLVQSALNIEAKQHQSEVEIMLAMFEAYRSQIQSNLADINWKDVEKVALTANAPCAQWASVLCSFVRKTAGGSSGELIHDLCSFQKAFACNDKGPQRMLGS